MTLDWQEQKGVNPFETKTEDETKYLVFYSDVKESDDNVIKAAIEASVDKSISLFSHSIRDNSCFIIFEWNPALSTLIIAVTDDRKEHNSPEVVKCHFSGLNDKMRLTQEVSETEWRKNVDSYSEDLKIMIRDYLTTCSAFMRFSLIAAFHSEDRSDSVLL